MKTLKWLNLAILVMAAVSFGQTTPLNWRGYDTCAITNFKADTFRVCRTLNFSNIENKALLFVYDDTSVAARKLDTCVAEIGYQLGTPFPNLAGANDTLWSNCIVLDTVSSLTASKRYDPKKYGGAPAWGFDASLEQNLRPHGQIDTTIGTSSSGMYIPIPQVPYWSPYGRFYIHGLTGNTGTFLKSKFYLIQRASVNVKQN
jgi:hypothetical protein